MTYRVELLRAFATDDEGGWSDEMVVDEGEDESEPSGRDSEAESFADHFEDELYASYAKALGIPRPRSGGERRVRLPVEEVERLRYEASFAAEENDRYDRWRPYLGLPRRGS